MPIVVNSNTTATVASFNLSRANDALRTSLARLSSGKRIVNPADDAGGLSVANKLASKLDRTEAVRQNVQNGVSYLQVQDGALSTLAKVVDRMAELRTMASDVTKNTGDIENYSKEFIELQKQMNQMYNEKFNGISLFSMSRSERITNPPDLRPTLDKNDTVKDSSGRHYQSFSRNVLTTADGVQSDGNVSLNVTNLQYLTSLGGLDTTYITETAAAIIEAQKLNNEQANNSDGNGERNFINIGNVNGDNSNDWTDNSTANAIIGVISNPDSVSDFTIGAITTGTQAKENGIVYDLGATVANWADGNFVEDEVVYHVDSGRYYKAGGAISTGDAEPGANANWTDVGTTLAELQADGDFGVTVGTAANFTDQAAVDAYMQNEIYTEDNFLKSIMFVSMGAFTDMIERIADARAENGAEQNRLNMTSELLVQNQTNLEAAHGRIMDADVALESTRFARQNVLVQSSAAMVAQANQLTNIALTILG
jgi:flagellin-like hook-associated protein FlgL